MKTLGARIAYLRKEHKLSQEELAQQLRLARTTLALIETNKRKITIEELQKFAAYFTLSLDELVDEQFPNTLPPALPKGKSTSIRMHIPALSLSKMEQVVLYVLQQCAGKPNVGETALYKLLYFSDFNYYEQYEDHLSGASYKKLQHGPVPKELKALLMQMQEEGKIELLKTNYFGYAQTRYFPLITPDLRQLKASETTTIDQVIQHLAHFTASELSDYSHQDIPWKATKIGEDIDYELAFYREAPFSVRQYSPTDDLPQA
ncbi:MAG: type II toxin-antitoxin system antitoxin SocA domain-containing protein [Flavobacteriaceae bacterium]